MLQVPVLIEGMRLRLRRSTPADAATTFAIACDPEVMRYLEWPAPQCLADTQDFLDGCAARWHGGAEHHWMIELKAMDLALGCIGCRISGHAADFGYFLARAHWGQGYATEAAGLLVGWLRRQGGIVRISATTDADNQASASVLRKLGLQQEGVLRKATVRPNIGLNNGANNGPKVGPNLSAAPRDTALFASVQSDGTSA